MKTFQKLQKKFVEFASVQQQCEIIPPTSATIRQYILPFYKQRNSIDVFRNKESNKTHLARAAKKLTANIYHFGVTSEASLACRKLITVNAVVKSLAEVDINVFNKNGNAPSYILALDNAL